jgi:biopolymer transport protein ExbD
MRLFGTNRFGRPGSSFNLTPIIDIVFLLIIFFMLLCQFIVVENFPVSVPDRCGSAQTRPSAEGQITTITVMKSPGKAGIDYAVGSEKINASSQEDLVEVITKLLNAKLKGLPPEDRIVTLRIDKDVCFTEAQYTLAALAESTATNINLAVLKDAHVEPHPEPSL